MLGVIYTWFLSSTPECAYYEYLTFCVVGIGSYRMSLYYTCSFGGARGRVDIVAVSGDRLDHSQCDFSGQRRRSGRDSYQGQSSVMIKLRLVLLLAFERRQCFEGFHDRQMAVRKINLHGHRKMSISNPQEQSLPEELVQQLESHLMLFLEMGCTARLNNRLYSRAQLVELIGTFHRCLRWIVLRFQGNEVAELLQNYHIFQMKEARKKVLYRQLLLNNCMNCLQPVAHTKERDLTDISIKKVFEAVEYSPLFEQLLISEAQSLRIRFISEVSMI